MSETPIGASMADRWTAETEELVRNVLVDFPWGIVPIKGAERVLTALADAGLLLPPGETRWKRGHGASTSGYERSVTTWPDGSQLFGPWVAVSET